MEYPRRRRDSRRLRGTSAASPRLAALGETKLDCGTPRRYRTIIAEGFFAAEDDQRAHVGASVEAENGDVGTLAGPFGKAGKSKVDFPGDGTAAIVGMTLRLRL